jgi:hypothetical protein
LHIALIKLGRPEVEKIARELILLADPFADEASFRPELIVPEFADLEKQVVNAYFEDAEFVYSTELALPFHLLPGSCEALAIA